MTTSGNEMTAGDLSKSTNQFLVQGIVKGNTAIVNLQNIVFL